MAIINRASAGNRISESGYAHTKDKYPQGETAKAPWEGLESGISKIIGMLQEIMQHTFFTVNLSDNALKAVHSEARRSNFLTVVVSVVSILAAYGITKILDTCCQQSIMHWIHSAPRSYDEIWSSIHNWIEKLK